jgi:hypothetical protein
METVKIGVFKTLDGYTFSILPSLRERIKSMFPNAHPANIIFVGYDTNSGFEKHIGSIESQIYPALLGISRESDLKKIGPIEFIDSSTNATLLRVNP